MDLAVALHCKDYFGSEHGRNGGLDISARLYEVANVFGDDHISETVIANLYQRVLRGRDVIHMRPRPGPDALHKTLGDHGPPFWRRFADALKVDATTRLDSRAPQMSTVRGEVD